MAPGGRTYANCASDTLRGICEALDEGASFERHLAIQSRLFDGWGQRVVPEGPLFPSHIGDDHSPYEYSLAFEPGGAVELRLLVEAQAASPTPAAVQAAALRLNSEICEHYRLPLTRFEAVENLFIVDEPRQFSLWHAVAWKRAGGADFKLYLNPQARGPEHSLALVKEAFERLGLTRSQPLLDAMLRRGERDELKYFSLDLSAAAEARVKVYVAHHDATLEDLETVMRLSPLHRDGDVARFCRQLLGDVRRFAQRAVTTCFSFTASSPLPSAATFHLPISTYLPRDCEALRSVSRVLRRHGADHDSYQRVFAAIARQPPGAGRATQSYASFRRERDGLRLTTYLSPRLFGERHADDNSHQRRGHHETGI